MTKVKIKNFQSIDKTEFDIDGFTVITGKNNIGKSAIIRAINSNITNRSGSEFIRNGKKQTEVSLEYDDLKIDWKKGTKTSYKVNDENFSALNRSVPKPLTNKGFRKIELNNIKLNPLFANQFKPLFLLDETGSVITEALSNIYKLDLPSRADDLCHKEIRASKGLLKTRKSDLEKVNKQLETFKDFDKIKDKVKSLRKKENEAENIQQEIKEIENYQTDLIKTVQEIKNLKLITEIKIPDTSGSIQYLDEINIINEWLKELKSLHSFIEKADTIKTDFENINNLENNIKVTNGSIKELSDIQNYYNEFKECALSAKDARNNLKQINESLTKLEKQKSEIKACPLCKRPF